jgi:hypothetical protein
MITLLCKLLDIKKYTHLVQSVINFFRFVLTLSFNKEIISNKSVNSLIDSVRSKVFLKNLYVKIKNQFKAILSWLYYFLGYNGSYFHMLSNNNNNNHIRSIYV